MRTALLTLLTVLAALLSPLTTTPAAGVGPIPGHAPVFRDARAAAAAAGSRAGTEASWSSGTVAWGASQSWVWNNASSARSYQAGLSPVGATTSASCQFEVTRSYYAQQPSGELEFRFTIKNIGTITCATNILLASATNSSVGSTGVLDPGKSLNATWNNAIWGNAHLVALAPSGATRAAACQFEVTREYYAWLASTELEFRFTVKNVGTITCQASIRIAFLAFIQAWTSSTLAPGSSTTTHWNNADPLNRVYVPAFMPQAANCEFEATRTYYVQRLNSGIPEREFYLNIKNVGDQACYSQILLADLDA